MEGVRDDRILPATRIVSALVIPFLLVAFVILYVFPESTPERFAFPVRPDVMAAYVGSGYIGGAWLFVRALFGRRWHRVASGFPAITTFTVSMLASTLLFWPQFNPAHFPFVIWVVLYVVTPVLVPWIWRRNQATDPGTPEPGDAVVPRAVRLAVRAAGIALLAVAVPGIVWPQLVVAVWPWRASLLAGSLLAGWGALIAVGNIVIAGDARWSAWRTGVESLWLWHLLFLVAAAAHRGDFSGGNLLNWYVVGTAAVMALTAGLYAAMELRRRGAVERSVV